MGWYPSAPLTAFQACCRPLSKSSVFVNTCQYGVFVGYSWKLKIYVERNSITKVVELRLELSSRPDW